MINTIWLGMMIIAVITAFFTGKIPNLIFSVTDSAKFAFNLALGLTGIMTLWLGIMKIAEQAGFIRLFTRLMQPLLIQLFPDVPPDHPAMGAITMNISANMMGLNNASTPFGLQAMAELEKINPHTGTATNAMCTFVILHSSNLQIIPTTAIALLAAAGATHPTDIIVPFLLGSLCAIFAALFLAKFFTWLPRYRIDASKEGAV